MQKPKLNILSITKHWTKVDMLLIIFGTAIFISILYFFPRPYYYVWADAEPDYLGNALHILEWGAVCLGNHPGIITAHLVAILIQFGQLFQMQLEDTILLIRLTFVIITLFCSYRACTIYKVARTERYLLILSIALILPPVNYFIDLLGPEVLLYGLCLLTTALIYRYVIEDFPVTYVLPILLGLCLAIKFSSIPLVLLVLVIHIFYSSKIYFTKGNYFKKIKQFLIFYIVLIVSFMVFLTPSYYLAISAFNNLLNRLRDDFNLFDVTIVLTVGILTAIKYRRLIHDIKTDTFFIYWVRVLLFLTASLYMYYLLSSLFYNDDNFYNSLSFATRNLIPLASLLFVPNVFGSIGKIIIKFRILLFSILIVAFVIKGGINNYYIKFTKRYSEKFEAVIDKVGEKANYVLFYPSSEFISKDLFELWTFLYGNSMIDLQKYFNRNSDRKSTKINPLIGYFNRTVCTSEFLDNTITIHTNDNNYQKDKEPKRLIQKIKKYLNQFSRGQPYGETTLKFYSGYLYGFPSRFEKSYGKSCDLTGSITSDWSSIVLIVPSYNADYFASHNGPGSYLWRRNEPNGNYNLLIQSKLSILGFAYVKQVVKTEYFSLDIYFIKQKVNNK